MKLHYTYRISNIIKNKHYYGIRTAVNPHKDLGIKYFSSSSDKEFIKDQKNNPENYKYKIIFIFNNRIDAIKMEIKLHNKMDVGINENFYNKVKQTSIGFDTSGLTGKKCHRTGTKMSNETKEKLRNINLGKIRSEESKLKQRGYKHTNEAKYNISKNHRGISAKDNPSAKKFKFISPQGIEYIIEGGGKKFCERMELSWNMFMKYPNEVIVDRKIQQTIIKQEILLGGLD